MLANYIISFTALTDTLLTNVCTVFRST
uniref:Uncharacterized protein n=1 Tax=Anguilla anguilla TaxID=7936 RepID=A0A0E9S7T6_ANGAN